MKRIVLAFLLLALATLTIPALRERAEPRVESSLAWLAEKLEGPLTPALTPYRTMKTETRVAQAARLLIRERNLGRPVPTATDFPAYLDQHRVETLDAWGAPIIMRQEPDSVAVRSSGPDGQYDTEDDIVKKVRYRAPASRVRRR